MGTRGSSAQRAWGRWSSSCHPARATEGLNASQASAPQRAEAGGRVQEGGKGRGLLLSGEGLTFMVQEVLEARDGTSTVNGPDVVRISRQPWSGGQERVHQNRSGGTLRHQSLALESCASGHWIQV